MGISAKIQPQSKPTRLKLPLVPEEVTLMAVRHSGMELTWCRLKNRVGRRGSFARSSMVCKQSGEKPSASQISRYSGQCLMW